MFDELRAGTSFIRMEEEVRRSWRRHEVPEAVAAVRRDGLPYTLLQEPVPVVGRPLADQVRLLATADLLARYRTMRGDAVERRAGWAGHGLPVEVAVEQALGPALGGYDLAEFNAACREAALDGIARAEALAERLAVWLDPDETYSTLAPRSIGAAWAAFHKLWEAGRLQHSRRVVPLCPRCATPLSTAEAARRATEVEARSVWVRLPWVGEADTYLSVFVREPWQLVALSGLAVHPEARLALVEVSSGGRRPPARLLVAERALDRAFASPPQVARWLAGRALRGAHYRPPFTFLPAEEGLGRVLVSDEVPAGEGRGLWPVTPAFDPLSLSLAQTHGLLDESLLDDWGRLDDAVTPWRGLSPEDAEPLIVEDLRVRGLLLREEAGTRPRAICPYCDTPLLTQARTVWSVETGSGPWVVGRDRAWGSPLPIWTCEDCGEQACVAGLDDLARRAGLEAQAIDLHRPAVDRIAIPCPACGETMRRVPEVADADFEAAVLPQTMSPRPGPANLAVGLGDEHLGWLGNLTELSALLHDSLAWERASALADGERGADWKPAPGTPTAALRWAAYTGTSPDRAEEAFLHPLWELGTALAEAQSPSRPRRPSTEQAFLDRWLQARLQRAIGAVTEALEAAEPRRAARELESLARALAEVYLPHRFGGGGESLKPLALLLAPFLPHQAEILYRQATLPSSESVHLAAWPGHEPAPADPVLLAMMSLIRRLVALGLEARRQAGVEPDQRLPRAWIGVYTAQAATFSAVLPFLSLLTEMLGVGKVEFTAEAVTKVRWQIVPKREQAWAERRVAPREIEAAFAALEAREAAQVVSQLWKGLSTSLLVGERSITLLPQDVVFRPRAGPGCAAAAREGHLLILEVG